MFLNLVALVVVLWVIAFVVSAVEGLNKPFLKWQRSLPADIRFWLKLGINALYILSTFAVLYQAFWLSLGYLATKMNSNPEAFGMLSLGLTIGVIFTLIIGVSTYAAFKKESDGEISSDKKK